MATVTLHGNQFNTAGDLPKAGSEAPEFKLVDQELKERSLGEFAGRKKLLSIFPSVDTPVCAISTKKFNDYAREDSDAVMLMISADLPFAQKRFCGDEGLENVITLSSFRADDFSGDYGIGMTDGPLAGLLARAILVVDGSNTVRHAELVPEIGQEPDYEAALDALKKC